MDAITALAKELTRLPGIGPRQARRIAYHLLAVGPSQSKVLAERIKTLSSESAQCPQCYRFFAIQNSAENKKLCLECADPMRNKTILLVVERDTDLDTIRKSDMFGGRFFVLGGSLPILETDPSKKIRIRELVAEIERAVREDNLHEIIFATSTNEEGEHTAQYVSKTLEPLAKKHSLSITTLGRGLSTGAELEYADSETLKNALKNRG
ncbi:MAG: toprim domain-containing protein [Minisyncoccota bacterium]